MLANCGFANCGLAKVELFDFTQPQASLFTSMSGSFHHQVNDSGNSGLTFDHSVPANCSTKVESSKEGFAAKALI